jgi:UTP--glucose-1-phosphate uridylyltransferase
LIHCLTVDLLIAKAVFPVAGLGTRFLPATKASPKEMLPIVDKPLIQYVVDEAYASGIRQMIFVTGRTKRAIEDHYDVNPELEDQLQSRSKNKLLNLIHEIKPDDMSCIFIRQDRPLGLGHAVLCAKDVVGDHPFAVLLADDLMRSQVPVTKQLVDMFNEHNKTVIAVENVANEHVDRYGIVVTDEHNKIIDIVEKPKVDEAKSTLAVSGRYIFTPDIFTHLESVQPGAVGEIQLTDAIKELAISDGAYVCNFRGKRYDCGDKLGYLKATVMLALEHEEVGDTFKQWVKNIF